MEHRKRPRSIHEDFDTSGRSRYKGRKKRRQKQNYRSREDEHSCPMTRGNRWHNERGRGFSGTPSSSTSSSSSQAIRSHQDGHQASSSTSTGQEQEESDLPGFYYDKEKKTYFKILPNTMSSLSSFVTKETIRKNEAEKKRLSDVEILSINTVLSSKMHLTSKLKTVKRPIAKNLTDALKQVQCGQFTCENFRTYMIRHSCLTLQPDCESVRRWPMDNNLKIEDIQKLMVNSRRDQLVCVWSLKSSIAQCLQLLSIDEGVNAEKSKGSCSKRTLTIKDMVTIGPIFKKVTTLCWAPMKNLPDKNTILFTSTCPVGYSPSIVNLTNLDASTPEARNVFELNLGKKMVWSSAWHSEKSQFSVGSERMCNLVDVATRRMWTYNVGNSDPMAQVFSHSHENILFNGTRAGTIFKHDTRIAGTGRASLELKQKHGIACLRLLQDDNYIMASDFSGTIVLWDQRVRKAVNRYEGLVNSHYQLPFNCDETESIVCAVGSDSYTKLWDRRNGNLLRTIPPPYPASLESFPIAHFSTGWMEGRGGTALVIAMKDKFKIYRSALSGH